MAEDPPILEKVEYDSLPSVEEILSSPLEAENRLHAALMLRALKWLGLLEQDDLRDPNTGKLVVDLETQVAMFNTISNWLKTSKKTKSGEGETDGIPGIDHMRALIREELKAPVVGAPKEERADPEPRIPRRILRANDPRKPSQDDTHLDLLLKRARESIHPESTDGD